MLINEVAKLTGLSIRTLHYYHEIGLVVPIQYSKTGYRVYEGEHLKSIEHIQFFKDLGFTLKDIDTMMKNKQFNSLEAFQLQHQSLLAKQKLLEHQIKRIEQLIEYEQKGEYTMTLEHINFNSKEYEHEARAKWGNEAVDDSIFRLKHLTIEQQTELKKLWDTIYSSLAKQMMDPVTSVETEQLVASYYKLLNTYFGHYDYQAFVGLGQLYTADERFTANIDCYAPGLASYMCEAMASWGLKQIKNN